MGSTEVAPAPIPRLGLVLLAAVIMGLFLIGSLADYSVSAWVYKEGSFFATVFAAYGEAPALVALIAAGTLAVQSDPPVHRVLNVLLTAGGALLITVAGVALVLRPEENWDSPTVVRTVIAMLIGAVTVYLTYLVAQNASWQAMCIVAGVLFTVVAAEMVIVQGMKILWERPRMRMITETGAPFSPWWSPGYEDKDLLVAGGVESSEFASFPSGHTANAAIALAFTSIGLLTPHLQRWARRVWWFATLWLIVVAISRVIAGAHFLSDIAAGMAIGVGVVWIGLTLGVVALNQGFLNRLIASKHHGADPVRHGG